MHNGCTEVLVRGYYFLLLSLFGSAQPIIYLYGAHMYSPVITYIDINVRQSFSSGMPGVNGKPSASVEGRRQQCPYYLLGDTTLPPPPPTPYTHPAGES